MPSDILPSGELKSPPFLVKSGKSAILNFFLAAMASESAKIHNVVLFNLINSLSQSIELPRVDDFLQELAAIQQTSSKRIALLGSRHVPITHQQLIEMLSYAIVLGGNQLITSGATGTNSAAIRGAMRADPNLLTVILPQSMSRQPRESRDQLEQVIHLVENPKNDSLSLPEASAMCNQEIISRCQQLICFAFHESHTLLKTCQDAEEQRKVVTLFYFD
jgi:hypothetical protein